MIRVAVDVETSGFKPFWHDVITVGLVVYEVKKDFSPIATFYGRARPWTPKTWDEGSTEAHKFLLEDTLGWPDVRTLCIQILHFLKPFFTPQQYLLFVYHAERNFDFLHLQSLFVKADLQFSLYRIFSERHTRSTLIEARDAGYQGNKLSMWASRLNMELDHHNALSDAKMCAALDCFLEMSDHKNVFDLKSKKKEKKEIVTTNILQGLDLV